ncbi:MAG: hypothetical protein IPJ01_10365 [Micavibrio sp.]|nr:hypothetical protein [Micavibrio sp.]
MNKELINYQELLNRKEELHEDLLPYLNLNEKDMFDSLKHPLVYSVPYSPAMNALLNKRYEVLSEDVKKAFENKKYDSYIFMHERPYRLKAFLDVESLLDDNDYWEFICDIWVDSENIWQNIKTWKKLLGQRKETKGYFMSEDDKKAFDNLPDKLIVYRGYVKGKNEKGLSYTTDENKAKWFAKRFYKDGEVTSRYVDKKDVFAYTNRRSENEIILLK